MTFLCLEGMMGMWMMFLGAMAWADDSEVRPFLPAGSRVAVLLDGSYSQEQAGWTGQRERLGAWLESVNADLEVGVVIYAAAAEWSVNPWVDPSEVLVQIPELGPLEHGSELAFAVEFARDVDPPPTHIWAMTDGLLASNPDPMPLLASLAADPSVWLEQGLHPVAPSSMGGHTEAGMFLGVKLAEAMDACVPKKRHQRALPARVMFELTRLEIVGLDLGATDERWRFCIAERVSDFVLGPPLDTVERQTVKVPLRPAD